MRIAAMILALLALSAQRALAQETFTVEPKRVADEKAVFATVESANIVPARARIGGTVAELGVKEGDEVITHSLVTKSIGRSQKRVEAYNFEIRKRLIEYDDVMNKQREVIYGRRDEVMEAEDLKEILELMVEDTVDAAIEQFIDPTELPERWPLDELIAQMEATFLSSVGKPPVENIEDLNVEDLRDHVRARALDSHGP